MSAILVATAAAVLLLSPNSASAATFNDTDILNFALNLEVLPPDSRVSDQSACYLLKHFHDAVVLHVVHVDAGPR